MTLFNLPLWFALVPTFFTGLYLMGVLYHLLQERKKKQQAVKVPAFIK